MIVKVGAFGVRNDFQIQDELLIESGDNVAEVAVGVGIELSVEEPNISPSKFELRQNYPNLYHYPKNIFVTNKLIKPVNPSKARLNLYYHKL